MSIPRNLSFLAEGASSTGVLAVTNGGTGVTTSTGTGSVVLSTTPTFTTNITAPLVIGGTAASSALTLESTSGTGTTDYVAFLTGSQSERMRITSAGTIGMGTSSPTSTFRLHLTNDGAPILSENTGAGVYMLDLKGSASTYNVRLGNSADSFVLTNNNAERMRISSAGNMGIGTTNPTACIHVPGNSTTIAALFTNIAEPTTVSATAATGTIALYPSTQSILYYTSNASANWTTNITFSSGTTMNTAMSTGQTMTVTFWVTQGTTAYYNNLVWVDGAVTGVTTKWLGGAPTAGNTSGIDVYTYSVTKTAASTFTVLATVAQFK